MQVIFNTGTIMKTPGATHRSACPINLTLETVGDGWTLLIVRDMVFKGMQAFNEFLGAEEGIATNILTDRLRRLESAGIVDKHRDIQDTRRFVYRLTPKGIDLAPILVDMVLWAAQHERADVPEDLLAQIRQDREGFLSGLRAAWQSAQT